MNAILLGAWFFSSLIYQGSPMPRPNPDLIMQMHFLDDQTNLLRYERRDEQGFCEREARYEFDGKKLIQVVSWVNPKNNSNCASDPDMQLGSSSITPLSLVGDTLHMVLPLGEESLTYVWTRTLEPEGLNP